MSARTVLVVSLMLIAVPVAAQDDLGAAAKGAVCSMVVDSLARLNCFDRAFPKDAAIEPNETVAPSTVAEGTGEWQIERDKSAMDDSPKVIAYLPPSEGASYMQPGLIVRCVENTTSVILSTGSFSIGDDRVPVTSRFDSGERQVKSWDISTTGSSVGLWTGAAAIPFLKQMRGAQRLAVRITMNQQVDMTFDLAGAGAVIDEVAAACGWSPAA